MHPLSSMVTQLFIFFSIIAPLTFGLQATDFYVHDLPLLPKETSSIRMHAGLLPVNPQHNGSLFFWHFEKKYASDKLRTVIWLNGGPGCSSSIGAWMEIGPFRFQDQNTMIENDGSWHLYTNLLFVDQPVGTGFSTIDTDSFIHELDEMANQFLSFLDQYIKVFPELLENDIYLAGESFAGQYIPYIAKAILEQRSALKLRGLLIGNGLIDPVTIYKSYLPFAVANNLIIKNSNLYDRINIEVKQCEEALSKQNTFTASHSKPSIILLPDLLQQIPIILYSGEYDLLCNHWAIEAMIDGLIWNNGTGFDFNNGTLSPKDSWIVDGESAGLIRSARNLTYMLFYGASHMVPYDYPRRSRFMLHQFIQLDLISFPDTTTRKNIEVSTRLTRHIAFSVLIVIIVILALIGLIWCFVLKRHPTRLPTPLNIIRELRPKTSNVEQPKSMACLLLNDSNTNLHVADSETFYRTYGLDCTMNSVYSLTSSHDEPDVNDLELQDMRIDDEKSPTMSKMKYEQDQLSQQSIGGGSRRSLQRISFPVARYNHRQLPLRDSFISFMPWTSIFADRRSRHTFIYSKSSVYVIPPLINRYGKRFSIAELIAAGYASFYSNGKRQSENFDIITIYQPSPLSGSRIPKINPRTGGFTGGMHTNYGSFSSSRYEEQEINIAHNSESEEDEDEEEEKEENTKHYSSKDSYNSDERPQPPSRSRSRPRYPRPSRRPGNVNESS
ncbi:unnamed protein product [Adineta steineri]|uniref:Pheromone-processing carboxypeptidase KEX1 n=1 Tax=Adineta steineri TaxID=433720 RepID=A0A815E5Q0_9BILA|nr:unnamed protein product [Adineta steineri]